MRYASAGTVVAAAGNRVTAVQIVVDGELELMARGDAGRATMAVVRSGGVIADIPDRPLGRVRGRHRLTNPSLA